MFVACLGAHGAALGQAQKEATAAPRPPDAQTRARDLYRQGSEAFEEGDNSRAVRLLRAAWALRRTYDVAGTLAQAELELGLYRDAAEHLEFCVRNFPLHESQEENDSIRTELERLRARLARVQLRVIPDGAEVRVNGRVVGRSPLDMPLYLEPGTHTLAARLENHSAERKLKTEAGLEQSIELRVDGAPPISASAADTSTFATGASSGKRTIARMGSRAAGADPSAARDYTPAIIVAGVGIAAIVTGIGLTLAASSDDSDREKALDRLPGTNPCGATSPASPYECRRISNLADSAKTFRVASYTSFGIALAASVAAVLAWPVSKDDELAISVVPTSIAPSLGASKLGVEAHIGGVF